MARKKDYLSGGGFSRWKQEGYPAPIGKAAHEFSKSTRRRKKN